MIPRRFAVSLGVTSPGIDRLPRASFPCPHAHFASLGILLSAIVLSGCATQPSSPQAQADRATRAACERRAEQAYEEQNRAEIFSPQSQVNTPYSANYTPDVSDRGLSDMFVRDRMVSDCIRNTGTQHGRTPPSPAH